MTTQTTEFRESLRYEYPLNENSFVIDVGGYHGGFAREMDRLYRCRILVFEPIFVKEVQEAIKECRDATLIPMAAGARGGVVKFGVQGDMTGAWNGSEDQREVPKVPLGTYIEEGGVDLLKLNCEGAEFEIIQELIDSGKIGLIKNLQVQFHRLNETWDATRDALRKRLLQTHELTYDFPWVWESYRLKEPRPPFKSHSQAHQDEFAWRILTAIYGEGWASGTFIDIGAGHPWEQSNSWALEQQGWKGILVERDEHCCKLIREHRKATLFSNDITDLDVAKTIWSITASRIDYLSLDIDINTLAALSRIPFDQVRFAVITIEHDAYRFGPEIRHQMREILTRAGYQLVCKDVGVTVSGGTFLEFEDWWVHPALVPEDVWKPFVSERMDGGTAFQ